MSVPRALVALIACSAAALVAGEPGLAPLHGLAETRYHRVESAIVEGTYHVFVRLPEEHETESEAGFPAVYLLDGGITFPLLGAYYRYLRLGEEIPPAIVVGISYGTADWRRGNARSRDFTAPSEERDVWGGAALFQRVLAEEILPLIEGTYPARPDRRVLVGHSLGGQFVLHTALTRPGLFWGHLASNPALHRNLPSFLADPASLPPGADRPRLFVSSGELDDPVFRAPALEWMAHWTNRGAPWELRAVTLPGHTHFSAPPAAFRAGLAWIFDRATPEEPEPAGDEAAAADR